MRRAEARASAAVRTLQQVMKPHVVLGQIFGHAHTIPSFMGSNVSPDPGVSAAAQAAGASKRGLSTWFSRWTWVNVSLSSCRSSANSAR